MAACVYKCNYKYLILNNFYNISVTLETLLRATEKIS